MAVNPQLRSFVDEELMRAPLLLEQVLQSAVDAARQDPAAQSSRQFAHELQQAVSRQSRELAQRFVASMREQVDTDLAASPMARTPSTAATLSLVDDDAVAVDVELSRVAEAIASVAEHELRELRTFTSALVGDVRVARDTNPLRPEVYARALWAAAEALPLPRGFQVALMRHAAMPLASALRRAYAAACTRLEDAGVEPGTYSTIVLPAGARTARAAGPEPDADLAELRDSMPVPLDEPVADAPPIDEALLRADEMIRLLPDDAGLTTRAQALDAQRSRLLGSAVSRVDQQSIELLSRLFDTILGDRSVPPAVQVLLSRLHATALRIALRDPAMLDSYDHPVWRFMDRIAFAAELHPRDDDPLREKLLAYLHKVVDEMSRATAQDAQLFQWALDRLAAVEQHLFEQRHQAAAGQFDDLPTQSSEVAIDTGQAPLDIGSMQTVPAELLERAPSASDSLPDLQPGQWVRAYHRGDWIAAQLLWRDERTALWVFADAAHGHSWAWRHRALERLHAEGLLHELRPRSLVRRAAEKVQRRFSESR